MNLLHGETVQVRLLGEPTEDAGGNLIVSFADPADVDNVLVVPGARVDVHDSERPAGARIFWTCHFPKVFTADLRGAEVSVRGGDWLKVIGVPGAFSSDLTPGDWDRPVEIGEVVG